MTVISTFPNTNHCQKKNKKKIKTAVINLFLYFRMRWTTKGMSRLYEFIQRWMEVACVSITWTASLCFCGFTESHQVCMVTPQASCVLAESSKCTLVSICSLPAGWPRSVQRIRASECKTIVFRFPFFKENKYSIIYLN